MDYLRRFWRKAGPYVGRQRGDDEEHEEGQVPSRLGSRCGPSIHHDYQDLKDIMGDGDFPTSRIVIRRDHVRSVVRAVRRANLQEQQLRRLQKEARLLHKLKSDHIIELYGWYEELEAVYMTTECCEGGELFERTAEKEAYSEQEARELVRALLLGVREVHEHGICLRNLQPQHLLLSDKENGVLKIADVKFAVNVSRSRGTSVGLLSDKSPFPEFVAPEILQHKSCGTEADIWSVGVITYILVGGYIPFQGKDKVDLLRKIRIGKFAFEDDRWGSISTDVKTLIQRMLRRKPEDRLTANDALRSTWWSLSDQLLESKSLNNSLSGLRIFNAKNRFRQIVICVVFVLYGLGEGHTDQDVQRTCIVGESGYCIPDSGLCLDRRKHVPMARASSCPLRLSPALHPLFERVRGDSRKTSVQDAARALALANLRDDNDSVSMSYNTSDYNPVENENEKSAVSRDDARLSKRSPKEPSIGPSEDGEKSVGPPPGPLSGRRRWTETLSSEHRVFNSKEYGVRLTVPGGTPPKPDPAGPVDLEHTAKLETCDSKTFLLCTVVHCNPEGAQFSAPLMLDFFVQYDEVEGDFSLRSSSEASKLSTSDDDDDQVLRDYQVLFKKGNGSWQIMPREKLSVVHSQVGGGETATFVRARVGHFCSFSMVREVTENDRYKQSHQRNKRTIVMRNTCDMKFLVVMMPKTAITDTTTHREITVKLSFAGFGIEGSSAGGSSTKVITLPAGCQPYSRTVICGERTEFDLDQKEGSARLILCTIKACSEESIANGGRMMPTSSASKARSVTPTSDVTGESVRVLQFWESIPAYGGRDITILPPFVEGEIQAEQVIPKGACQTLENYALALEGSYAQAATPTTPDLPHEEHKQGFRASLKQAFLGRGSRGGGKKEED